MWWVLAAVLILITLENLGKFRFQFSVWYNYKNYFWLFTNLILLSFCIPFLISAFSFLLARLPVQPLVNLSSYSGALQFAVFFLVIDFSKYVSHYFMHKFDFLWKIHLIHHSSETLNTLASFKHSWLEAFINVFLSCLLERFFRVDLAVLTVVNGLFIYVCIWQHSDIRHLRYSNRLLSAIFITPKAHRIHHERVAVSHHKNIGFVFTFWDRIFKSYSAEGRRVESFGIIEPDYPYHSNLRQFFYPFSVQIKTAKKSNSTD